MTPAASVTIAIQGLMSKNSSRKNKCSADSRPLIRNRRLGLFGIPRQFPAIGSVVLVEAARHGDNHGFAVGNVFPAVVDTRRNHHQALISLAEKKLVDAAEGRRFAARVVTNDAKRTAGREK